MFKEIEFSNGTVGMLANAASPFLYKQIFHEDFLMLITKENVDYSVIVKMGFIMAKQSELKMEEMRKLTEDDFMAWLEGFDAMEIYTKANEIMSVYMANAKTASVPKEPGA